MANTEHEHAGNDEQRRNLQNPPVARCNFCHFYLGQQLTAEKPIELEPVSLPDGTVVLFCHLCVQLCKLANDENYEAAAGMMRPLTAEDETENQKLLAEYENDARASQREDLSNY